MNRYIGSLSLSVLSLASVIVAQPSATPDIMSLITIDAQPAAQGTTGATSTELVVTNSSNKPISPYVIRLTTAIAGEPTSGLWIEDFLPGFASEGNGVPVHRYEQVGALRPGHRRIAPLNVGANSGPHAQPVVTAVPVAVVYADNTAVGDPQLVDEVFEKRAGVAESLTTGVARIKSLARPTPRHAIQDLRSDFVLASQQVRSVGPRSFRDQGAATGLKMMSARLEDVLRQPDPATAAVLDSTVAYLSRLLEVFREHSVEVHQ